MSGDIENHSKEGTKQENEFFYKSHKSSVVCLQETRCKDEVKAKSWTNEWVHEEHRMSLQGLYI